MGGYTENTAVAAKPRILSINILRGIVMVIMALDHVREFFSSAKFSPTGLTQTTAALFMTRWVTHFCAPVFVFLACLMRLPIKAITLIGLLIVACDNLLDGIDPARLGPFSTLFIILHVRESITVMPALQVKMVYPLIPWVGVMALGFAFGKIVVLEEAKRKRMFFLVGAGLIAMFVVLRALNVYGDPSRWSQQKDLLFTVLSFVNCTKYPPSLLYLLMMLGPAILALSFIKESEGRVAFFYYIMHLLLIHIMALVFAFVRYGEFPPWMFQGNPIFSTPAFPSGPSDYGYGLAVVYIVWLTVVILLFPLCRWYMNFKKTHHHPIFSYI
jgi:uncharacterized membrane protein